MVARIGTERLDKKHVNELKQRRHRIKKERIAVNGFPSHSYGKSLAIWDHTVLPATGHK